MWMENLTNRHGKASLGQRTLSVFSKVHGYVHFAVVMLSWKDILAHFRIALYFIMHAVQCM